MNNVIVTGGAGFVGSHLCEELKNKGFNVYSIDNYLTGSINNHIEGVTYYKDDAQHIWNYNELKPLYLFHLGEYSRVEQSFNDIDLVMRNNTRALPSILKFCKHNDTKLIYTASSTKYCDEGKNLSPYAWTKASNVEFIDAYSSWFDFTNYAVTYFYNVYGPREIAHGEYATVVAKFLEAYKQGQPLNVTGDGSQTRNFTHVKDIVAGLIDVGMNYYGDDHQLGNMKSYSILELANMIDPDSVQFVPNRKGNRMTSRISYSNYRLQCHYELSKYIEEQLEHINMEKTHG